ncbi:MAG: response regulator, partial [bacterium]|nr:response regulator [bacterium]
SLEALACFKKNPDSFQLVISDLNMPDMNGLQLSEEIYRIRPDIPFVLVTGFMNELQSKNLKRIKRTVAKPLITQKIADVIREVLSEGDAS